jgi:hypothetical protein
VPTACAAFRKAGDAIQSLTRPSWHQGGDEEEDGLDPHAAQRAAHPAASTIQDMGIDHRGRDVRVPEELLDRADVVSVREEVGGETVSRRMAS